MNQSAIVIPAVFLFIALEYYFTRKKKLPIQRSYESTVSNLSIGIAERLLNLFITGSFYGLYSYLYQAHSLWQIPQHWYVWVLLLLATDFVWYWYHRLGHEINIMWGAHVVHHQSEDFNYTVSARITTLQALIRNLFWCILPLAGFHPSMVMTILVVHGAYSFFTHTETIGSLGWIEKFLVTPSHHRVHHASNEIYLNKNYGDIFIFWDKLFGTFQQEKDKPVYGLTHPLKSRSFLWQHFHYYIELWEACKRSGGFKHSFAILFGKPEILDQRIRAGIERKLFKEKYAKVSSMRFRFYLTLQIVVVATGLFCFTLFVDHFSTLEKAFVVTLTLLTLINCGAMLEQQRWVFYLEITRALFTGAFVCYEIESPQALLLTLTVILIAAFSESAERWYYRMVYPCSS